MDELKTRARAERGALLLDRRLPGWHIRVSEPLSMQSMRNCVLAKLYDSFKEGAAALELDETQTLLHGFRADRTDGLTDMSGFTHYYTLLTKCWREEILKRM